MAISMWMTKTIPTTMMNIIMIVMNTIPTPTIKVIMTMPNTNTRPHNPNTRTPLKGQSGQMMTTRNPIMCMSLKGPCRNNTQMTITIRPPMSAVCIGYTSARLRSASG